jgi:hypothetical protein
MQTILLKSHNYRIPDRVVEVTDGELEQLSRIDEENENLLSTSGEDAEFVDKIEARSKAVTSFPTYL